LTFEQVRAVTWTRAEYDSAGNLTDGNYSDGTINLEGPLFYLFGKYPNTTPFTPYLELGVAYYSASWEANPAWRDSGGANSHIFVLDDTTGWAIGTGCEIAIYKGLCADIYWRYTEVDVGVHYYLYGKEQAINAEKRWRESFPMSNYAAGLGLKYVF
jgi:opacity protein-like surface antigen